MLLNFLQIFSAQMIGADCEKKFLGLPSWYHYLNVNDQCMPKISGINDFWLIGLAFIEILLRVAVLIGIAFVLYAGIKYSASRGNADKVESAKSTLIDALTGVAIAIVASAAVSFIAGQFTE